MRVCVGSRRQEDRESEGKTKSRRPAATCDAFKCSSSFIQRNSSGVGIRGQVRIIPKT